MSGGSSEPEGPRDKQCPKCNLYYEERGNSFAFHKAACDGDGKASEDPPGSTQTEENDASSDESSSTVMGSGNVPDSAQNRTELPCGCYSIQEHKYDPGIYACDDCGDHFKIT